MHLLFVHLLLCIYCCFHCCNSSLKIRFRLSRHFFKLGKSMLKLEAKYLLLPLTKYLKLTSNVKRGYLSTLKYIIKCLIFMFSVINFKIDRNVCTVCWHLVWENSQISPFVFTITKCAHNIKPSLSKAELNLSFCQQCSSLNPIWRRQCLPILLSASVSLNILPLRQVYWNDIVG